MVLGTNRRFSFIALAALCGIVSVPGFFTPYDYETQHRALALAPPTQIHFVGTDSVFHLRPFVYLLKPRPGMAHEYEEDRGRAFPIHFFVSGWRYKFGGFIPSRTHLFSIQPDGYLFLSGTDQYGRDVFARLLYGARISLLAGLLAAGISVILGTAAGALAGYYGSWIDQAVMRAAELFLTVPWLYLLLTIRAFLPLHTDPVTVFVLLIAVAGTIGWARPARLVRGVVLSGRDREYILAAKGFGASDFYILRIHILPQAYSIAMTQASLYIPQFITAEIVLSFFGLGVSEPVPSLGNMLAQLQDVFVLESCWWMYSPAILLVTVLLILQWFFRSEANRFSA